MTTSPLLFCHRMSARPSPLKSPLATACQLGPGSPRLPAPMTLVPFISTSLNSRLPIKPREVSEPLQVIDLMAPLKRSLAQEAPAKGDRRKTEERAKAVADRG